MLIKTASGGYRIFDKSAIKEKFVTFLIYVETFLTFLLGAVLVTGIVIQGFKTLTVKRGDVVQHEQVKHFKKRGKRR